MATFGIDQIDANNKYASAYFETMMLFSSSRTEGKTLAGVLAAYNSLPANTNIVFSYSVNGGAYVAMTSVTNTILQLIEAKLSVGSIGSLQIKVAFTVSSNDAPTMEALDVVLE